MRIMGIFIFCFALSFWMAQWEQWKGFLFYVQREIELEQDIGLHQDFTLWSSLYDR